MLKKILLGFFLIEILLIFPIIAWAKTGVVNTAADAVVVKKTSNQTTVRIESGDLKNQVFTLDNNFVNTAYKLQYGQGDRVIVSISKVPGEKTTMYISDVDRQPTLIVLALLFLVMTIIVARWQGVSSIVGMIFSFYVIVAMIIPNILAGSDPLLSVFLGAVLIIPVTYYLAHGFNKKTHIAIISTFATLALTGALAYFFTVSAKLTGFASEEATYLQTMFGGQIDIKSLLLAGIVVGALAVLNDITISQTSVVESLHDSNDRLGFWELYNHAMKVGHDHVASLVNTLILVYIGASFPLVILFYKSPVPLGLIANQEIIATEIIRTLVTSIGIISAVPIATYLACLFASKK